MTLLAALTTLLILAAIALVVILVLRADGESGEHDLFERSAAEEARLEAEHDRALRAARG